ncbi:sigma-54 interaction domain-containing protein [Ralstonia pickettii]|uniref:sigma-54 interaction domain-containing protein n=1 Tax=Ralstonia pickettii TaxID=329 RepID=UPI0015BB9668|nr:sigma-54 dependent transcriptional regulator [Ralstonia pickettii]NWK45938.1 sigma-54-dependent Fis family transcriptional regulator [Ralstonia pickettii]
MATFPVWPPPPGQEPAASTPEWIFEDPRSRALLDEVEQVAPSDAAVLISGETGTGKELIARYLHNRSARQGGPFVVVSCGAFSDTLVDAELFGHENGAFAGAFGTQVGWFEQANGGTIFLDEVNDLPLPVQNKLLRVLQEREIVRLGGRTPIPVDLRIVAATTVDLETLVQEKRFRKDLYYRLNVVNLNVLTLKERPGDIVPLARYFINTYSKRLGHARATLTSAAERLLTQSPWHGNVRELENVIHRTLLLCDGNTIDAPDLRLSSRSACAQTHTDTDPPIACATASTTQPSVPYSTDEADLLCQAIQHLCNDSVGNVYQLVEDALFREVFRYCHYSQSDAARVLGVSRNVVRARLIRLGEVGAPRTSPFAAKPGTPAHEDVMGT